MAIAGAPEGLLAAFGSHVPGGVIARLEALVRGDPPAPGAPPACLDACVEVLAAWQAPVEVNSGPTYLVVPGRQFAPAAPIITSAGAPPASLAPHPGAGWTEAEWRELLAGKRGPWAVALDGTTAISICHSPRLTEHAAEAGTWTAPEHRGRGLAAATTAAWANLFASSGHTLFYSTSAENQSSQRVTTRLALPELGWRWQLSVAP